MLSLRILELANGISVWNIPGCIDDLFHGVVDAAVLMVVINVDNDDADDEDDEENADGGDDNRSGHGFSTAGFTKEFTYLLTTTYCRQIDVHAKSTGYGTVTVI